MRLKPKQEGPFAIRRFVIFPRMCYDGSRVFLGFVWDVKVRSITYSIDGGYPWFTERRINARAFLSKEEAESWMKVYYPV